MTGVQTCALPIFAAAAGVLFLSAPLPAHHSFAAEFDSKKPVELKGTVTLLDWVNPHAWIYIEVKEANGSLTKWSCELGSPNILMRNNGACRCVAWSAGKNVWPGWIINRLPCLLWRQE